MKDYVKLSVYLCFLLRHKPDSIGLRMDKYGYVFISELISKINHTGKYTISKDELFEIVSKDDKQRFYINGKKIKCCQGHSIPWVVPELEYIEPPEFLYHGTTSQAYDLIKKEKVIAKQKRHAVHLSETFEQAKLSASRWAKGYPLVLKINARKFYEEGNKIGKAPNNVWCSQDIPINYIDSVITVKCEEYLL